MADINKSVNITFTGKDNVTATMRQVGNEAKKTTSQVENGFKKSNKEVADSEKGFKTLAVAGTAGLAAIGFGVATSIKAYADQQEQITKLTHVLKTSRGASEEQAMALVNQAEALSQVGVASDDLIMTSMAQLSVFDMQAQSISQLTPAIMDYLMAEKDANATTQDALALTNGLAQALQGKFESLTNSGFVLDEETKKMVSNGNETERVTALTKVLNSTYKGYNEALLNTPQGAIVALGKAFNNLKQTIGQALAPVILDLVNKFSDIVKWVGNFAKAHPDAVRWVLYLVTALSTLAIVVGNAGSMLKGASNVFAALRVMATSAAGGIFIVIAAFVAALAIISQASNAIKAYNQASYDSVAASNKMTLTKEKWKNASGESKKALEGELKSMLGVKDSTEEAGKSTDGLTDSMNKMGGAAGGAGNKAAEAMEKMKEAIEDENKSYRESLRDIIIKHNNTYKDLQNAVKEENQSFEDAQADKTRTYERQTEDMNIEHDRRVEDLEASLAQEIAKGATADQEKINELRGRIAQENADYDKQKARLEEDRQLEVKRDKETHNKKLAELQVKLNEEDALRKKYANDFSVFRDAKLVDDITALKTSHAEKMAEIKKNYDEQVAAAQGAAGGIGGAMNGAIGDIDANFEKMVEDAKAGMDGLNTTGSQKASVFDDPWINTLANIGDGIKKWLWDKPIEFISNMNASVIGFISRLQIKVLKIFRGMGEGIKHAWDDAISWLRSKSANIINPIIETINSIPGVPDMPKIPYALGGIVPSNGMDNVPALLSAGEMVLNKSQQNRLFNMLANNAQEPQGKTIDVNFNNVTVRNEQDLNYIIDAVRNTLSRDAQLASQGL